MTACAAELVGHTKKVSYIEWHPAAADILLSASADLQVKSALLSCCFGGFRELRLSSHVISGLHHLDAVHRCGRLRHMSRIEWSVYQSLCLCVYAGYIGQLCKMRLNWIRIDATWREIYVGPRNLTLHRLVHSHVTCFHDILPSLDMLPCSETR